MNKFIHSKTLVSAAVMVALATLAGCSKSTQEHKPGQALASVNGQEITVLQLNEEMARANVQPAQQEAARKQLLQVLVDRQLLQTEAEKEKLDRDPKVVQAVERAKSLIIAQAYLQKHIGNVAKPGKQEVEDYFNKNPQFFSNRKQYVMNELLVSGANMTDELKAASDSAHGLDELAAWLDSHKIPYQRGQVTRSTSDMPVELSNKLASTPKGQLFVVREPQRALFLAVSEVKDAPVTLATAAPQIEQFLLNKKNKEAAEAELARLRSTAKIEYLNGQTAPATTGPGAPGAAATAAAPEATTTAAADGSTERGVAGLK
ncbi:EpsD family peptidyl-prolyl cis-trans isomerase [Zemynaea arenosa]|nr:EpsD family peptidyl-prolyl cis-trans isomerase [Massilia arenosa]